MSQEVTLRKRIQRKETRYLQIVTEKIKSGKNNTAIAKQFGVDRRTVQRAFDWGYAKGIFDVDIRERLFHHIIEFTKQLDWINEETRLAVDQTRNEETGERTGPMNPMHLSVLSREERETRIKVLELEGLYRNVLNIKPAGMDEEKDFEVTWRIVDPDEGEIR